MADHHVRVRHLGQGLSAVTVLPTGFAFRGLAQRPGRGLSGPSVDGGSRSSASCPQLRFQIATRSSTRLLCLEFRDPASYISRIEFIWLCSARTIAIRSATPSSSIPQ